MESIHTEFPLKSHFWQQKKNILLLADPHISRAYFKLLNGFIVNSVNKWLLIESENVLKTQEWNMHVSYIHVWIFPSFLLVWFHTQNNLAPFSKPLQFLNDGNPVTAINVLLFIHAHACVCLCVGVGVCARGGGGASLVFRLNPIIPACLSTRISTLTHITHMQDGARQLGVRACAQRGRWRLIAADGGAFTPRLDALVVSPLPRFV